jgi:hypothetical protein
MQFGGVIAEPCYTAFNGHAGRQASTDVSMSALGSFLITLRTPLGRTPGYAPIEFASLEDAYCDVCAGIPETAGALLREGLDPMACSYLICDPVGTIVMDVLFTDLLRPHLRQDLEAPEPITKRALPGQESLVQAAELRASAWAECERTRRAITRSKVLMSDADRLASALKARPGERRPRDTPAACCSGVGAVGARRALAGSRAPV